MHLMEDVRSMEELGELFEIAILSILTIQKSRRYARWVCVS